MNKKLETDNLTDFVNSDIVKLFSKKALFTLEHTIPNKAEWGLFDLQFSKSMPLTYKRFADGGKLSTLELRTCILLLLGYDEKTIVGLTDTSSQVISTAKARANKKLFGIKSAISLKSNLLNVI